MTPIKVLHTEWSGGWGGQEMRILNEMLAVREQGIDVFLASTAHARLTEEAQKHHIPCFHLPFRGNADLKTLYGLYKIIKKEKIDIINTHSGKDTWVGGMAAKLARIKFIRTRHLSNAINPSRFNFINEMADYVLTTGEAVRADMIKNNRISPEKIRSLPTGIDDAVFDPARYERQAARKQFDLADDDFAIGIVAVLRRFKRHDLFIDMARVISEEFPKTVFLMAGEGPQRSMLEEKIADSGLTQRIRMTGHLSEPQILLAALDLFTLTSEGFEGVPQSVIQALMMGCPVIATDAGSTADLWRADNFKLIPQNDLAALLAAVRGMLKDPIRRAQYAECARRSVVPQLSLQQMTRQLIALYHDLLGRSYDKP